MKNVLRILFCLCLALASTAIFAQEPTGAIEGVVADPQNAVVPNANVTVRNKATNFTRSTTTADDGHYRFSQLPPGSYEIKVTGTNFKTSVVTDVRVEVGRIVPQDVKLEIGGAAEEVNVIGTTEAQVDRIDNTVAGVVADPQNAVVPNANVTVRNKATNFTRSTTTADDGHYRFSQLPPGTYEIKVAGTNFKTSVVTDVRVEVGRTVPQDVKLEVGGAAEEVNVIGTTEAQVDRTDNKGELYGCLDCCSGRTLNANNG